MLKKNKIVTIGQNIVVDIVVDIVVVVDCAKCFFIIKVFSKYVVIMDITFYILK